MKAASTYLHKGLLTVLLLLSGFVAFGNHLVGMDLFYTHISGNTYKITLIAYGNCGSAGMSGAYDALPTNRPELYIYDGDNLRATVAMAIQPPSTGVEITPVCPADLLNTQCTNTSYTIPGIKKFVYTYTYTLPYRSTVWRFVFTGNLGGSLAGRALSITNISSSPVTYIQLEDTLNNSTVDNSNPILSVVPTPFFCLDNNDNYNPGAVDPEGDSLTFSLVPGIAGSSTSVPGTSPVVYLGGYSGTRPLATSSFSFDPATGQFSFVPNALQRSLVVYNIEERRGGVLIGTSQREMTFLVLTCTTTPPTARLVDAVNGVIDDSTHFHTCANTGPFSVSINPIEPDTASRITVTYSGLPVGAIFSIVGNGTRSPHCTFSWTSTGVTPGIYTFFVTYTDNNCPLSGVQTLAYTIKILPVPTISRTLASLATCQARAAISVIPGGTSRPWTVKISNSLGDTIATYLGVTGSFIDSLSPGTYTITIFGALPESCTNSTTFTIAPPVIVTPGTAFTNPTYCGATDGTITLSRLTPGARDSIGYNLNGVPQPPLMRVVGVDSTIVLTGLSAGIYSNITVTYGRYCVSPPVGPLNLVNPAFTMRTLRSTNPDYCGICNGTVTLYGLRPGQTDTINYTWGGVPQTPIVRLIGADSQVVITGLCAGVYANFVARTSGVCVSNTLGPVTLTVPPFTMRALRATNPEYCGICNGSITLYGLRPGQRDTISYTLGGIPQTPVVRLIGTDSTATITGLCPGVYANFIARTGGVCVSNTLGPVTLTVPPFTMRAISYTNPEYCGLCNGSVVLYGLYPGQRDTISYTMDGVPQPPVVRLIGPDSMAVITGLCPGVYANFVARTGGVCVSNTLGPVTLTVPPFIIRSLSFNNPDYCGTCNGTITVHGLYPGTRDTVSYTRDGVTQTPVSGLVGADSQLVIRGLCQGVYNDFIARTGGACVSNILGPVTLTVPPFTMRTLRATNPEYCGICNGSITLYGLYPGETDTITYTRDGVAQPPIVRVIAADSQVVISGLCAGVYNNFVARTGGVCVSNTLGPVTLTVPPFTMRAITYTEPDYCGICNGTITLYGLHPGNLDTISYTKDGVPQPPIIRLIAADSQVVITGLCHGVYANFVARTGGICVSNTLGPVTLTVPPFTVRSLGYTNPEFCGICNGTISLYGLHPGNLDTVYYTVDGVAQPPIISLIPADSQVRMTGLCFGLYDNFVVRTGGSCITDTLGPANLVVPPFTMRKLGYTNPTKCGYCDGVIKLYGLYPGQTDTISYTLNGVAQPPVSVTIGIDSQVVFSGLCEGTYNDFIARTGRVCVSNALGPVTLVAPPITPGYTFRIAKTCKADTVYFTNTSAPASDLTYIWDFGDSSVATSVNPVHIYTAPGVYAVKLYITNGRCKDSITQFMDIDNLIDAGFTATPDSFLCQGKPVVFTNNTIGTAVSYTWFFGDGVIDTNKNVTHIFKKAGVYNVILAMRNYVPCLDTVRQVFEVDSISAISMNLTDSVLCGGHDVTFTGLFSNLGGTGTMWTFSDGTTMRNVNPIVHGFDKAGLYTVTLQAFYRACPDTSVQRTVLVIDHPTVYLGEDTAICPGGVPIILADHTNEGNKRARWLWNTGATGSQISVAAPGYYSVTVNVNGCIANDTVWVKNDCYMNIPNVFSPNGDGVNDYFFPRQFLTSGLTTFKMEIFNRWGQLIFETTNLDGRGWDGTFNGVAQPEGVFVFLISATFKDGQMERHQGNVTLIR